MKKTNDTNDLYDVFQWNAKVIDHQVDEVMPNSSWDQEGIHRLFVTDKDSIDLRLLNHKLLSEGRFSKERILLVGFAGNINRGDEQKAPFFFGLDIAEQMQLPVLAVADPTISKSKDLSIAWYAGNENMPNAIQIIGIWLNKLAQHYSARLVLFGGSSGSFGALSVLPYMTERTSCLVWNPHTSIAKCEKSCVVNYLKNAFPTRNSELSLGDELNQKDLAARLVSEGVYYDLQRNYQIPSAVKLLFLQNKTDLHTATHSSPFLNNLGFTINADNLANQRVDNVFAHFDTFDEKHGVPNLKTIKTCLKWLIDDSETLVDLASLDTQSDMAIGLRPLENQSATELKEEESTFELVATLEGSKLHASIQVIPGVFIKPAFAFYLFIDGKRTSIKKYSSENSVLFEISGHPNKIEVSGFVLDNGKRERKYINVDLTAG